VKLPVQGGRERSPFSREARWPQGNKLHAHGGIVVRVQPWASKGITDLLSASGCEHLVKDEVLEPTEKQPVRHSQAMATSASPSPGSLAGQNRGREGTTQWPYASENAGYWKVKTSLVIGINQTNHFTNQERPCTTFRVIEERASACHILSTCYPGNVPRVESN